MLRRRLALLGHCQLPNTRAGPLLDTCAATDPMPNVHLTHRQRRCRPRRTALHGSEDTITASSSGGEKVRRPLGSLQDAGCVRVPEPTAVGIASTSAWPHGCRPGWGQGLDHARTYMTARSGHSGQEHPRTAQRAVGSAPLQGTQGARGKGTIGTLGYLRLTSGSGCFRGGEFGVAVCRRSEVALL